MTVQETTQESLFPLLYGRDPVLPNDLLMTPIEEVRETVENEYVRNTSEAMIIAWDAAKETIEASQVGQNAQYDKGTKHTQLKEGDLVLKKEHWLQGHGHKFKPRYEGVYRINKISLTDAWIVPYGKPEERELNYLRKFEGSRRYEGQVED